MHLIKLIVAFFLVWIFASPVFAEIHKWKDAEGQTHYGDAQPKPENTKAGLIEIFKSDGYISYLDEGSITKSRDGLVHYIVWAEFAKPQTSKIDHFSFTSQQINYVANCSAGTLSFPKQTFFSGGSIVGVRATPDNDFVIPKGLALDTFTRACNAAKKQLSNTTDSALSDPKDEQPLSIVSPKEDIGSQKASSFRYQPWYPFFVGGFAMLSLFIGITWYKRYFKSPKSANELRRVASPTDSTHTQTRVAQEMKQQTSSAKTLYDVLGISRDASYEQILAGYKVQKELIEAQANQDAESKKRLVFIQHAKDVLLDQVKRAAYDARI